MSESDELKNIALVRALCDVWAAPDYMAEAMIPFFAEDCAVRLMHTLPFAHGAAAVVEQARALMPLGTERMKVRHLSTHFAGPMVVAHRIDTLVIPGKPDSDWEMLGVFLIEDGKVKEWTDYMLTPFTQAPDGTVNA
jgi:limonene-1,2-epoxide hydrolase